MPRRVPFSRLLLTFVFLVTLLPTYGGSERAEARSEGEAPEAQKAPIPAVKESLVDVLVDQRRWEDVQRRAREDREARKDRERTTRTREATPDRARACRDVARRRIQGAHR